jgi:hypothetical protein
MLGNPPHQSYNVVPFQTVPGNRSPHRIISTACQKPPKLNYTPAKTAIAELSGGLWVCGLIHSSHSPAQAPTNPAGPRTLSHHRTPPSINCRALKPGTKPLWMNPGLQRPQTLTHESQHARQAGKETPLESTPATEDFRHLPTGPLPPESTLRTTYSSETGLDLTADHLVGSLDLRNREGLLAASAGSGALGEPHQSGDPFSS